MIIPSKKVALFALLALSVSTTTPIAYAADIPYDPTHQENAITIVPAESPAPVTEEQIRKDWPQVMRMVTRINEQLDRTEKAQRILATTAKVVGGAFCVGLLLMFIAGK